MEEKKGTIKQRKVKRMFSHLAQELLLQHFVKGKREDMKTRKKT
jgi:hypothetical protein